ncbi:MAG: ELWxxDGT repeat protein [Nostoc sp.]|uniref:ELWxxDGT repeat protein n=1 Tax=Nostoc sp. TaxID=1180 RepID=UPI002FF4D426
MPTYTGFPDPGSSRNTALDTTSALYIGGSLSSNPSIFQDSVTASTDTSDFYKISIGAGSSDPASAVRLRLSNLTGNASLILYDEGGATLQTANSSGTTPELITRSLNPGIYYLRVGSVSGASTNYDLSLSANPININKAGDDSLAQAFNIGSLTSSYTTTDYVGDRGLILDSDDYYQFNVVNSGAFTLNLNGLGGDANVELQDSSGTIIQSSTQTDTNPESISRSLASGTYYIRVYPGAISATNYTLNLDFTADPVDNAGNTLATARNINTLSSTPSNFTDYVNSIDSNDYYRFDLTSNTLVDLTLTPQTADANVQILDSNGAALATSSQTGITPDIIRHSLNAGVYYIRVYPASGAATNYDLSVSATSIASDIAPNTRGTAKNIGTLDGSQDFSDFIGNIDTDDYYRFNLVYKSQLTVSLLGLSDNPRVDLLNSSGATLQTFSISENTPQFTFANSLVAGTYYVRINSLGANTFYNLSLLSERQFEKLEIFSGPSSSNPNNLTALGSTLYFTANDGNGIQLWKSDGSLANTTKLTNINPASFNPDKLTVFGSKLLFSADDGTNGRELWVYDGTTANRVSNINPGLGSSDPKNLTVVGNKAFFSASDGTNGNELWVYDGTTVSLVKDIYSGSTGSNPSNLIAFNNKLYFAAGDSVNGVELWSSDGTAVGSTLVKNIRSGGLGSALATFTTIGSTLYFTANDGINGLELWKSDGTNAGTTIVKDITSGTGGFGPTGLTALGSTLYFVTDSNSDFKQELWKSDGTNAGTVRVKNDLTQAPNISFGPLYLTGVGSTLYFTTYDTTTGLELWKSNGTDAGTVLVNDIWEGPDPNSSFPDSLVNFGNTLYFVASESASNREVWSSDGTDVGTKRVSNINSTDDANPTQLTVVGTRLFFTATNGTDGTELWVL